MKKLILLLVFIPLALLGQEEDTNADPKKNVGVMNFNSRGVSEVEAEVFTETFRSVLVESDIFIVLDRNNMSLILGEQSFQQSGCTDASCAVEIGKMLNMHYMIIGNLVKIDDGEGYTVFTDLVNVESGTIDRSANIQFESMNEAQDISFKLVENLTGEKVARRDLNRFLVYAEDVYLGFYSLAGSPDSDQELEDMRYDSSLGAEVILRGRLFGEEDNVLKWLWAISFDYTQTTTREDREDNSYTSSGADNLYARWYNLSVVPFTAVGISFNRYKVMIGGDINILHLREYGTFLNQEYSSHFTMPGVGPWIMQELVLGDDFKLYLKLDFDHYFFLKPEDYLAVHDLEYDISRFAVSLGFGF